jgi:hypothetical protein
LGQIELREILLGYEYLTKTFGVTHCSQELKSFDQWIEVKKVVL